MAAKRQVSGATFARNSLPQAVQADPLAASVMRWAKPDITFASGSADRSGTLEFRHDPKKRI